MKWMQRLAIAAMGWGYAMAGMGAEPPDGQQVFARRCASCHTVQKLAPGIRKEAAASREASLQKRLERHFPPPGAERAALVGYLVKQAGD